MPKFAQTYCSQCGRELGPGDAGVSHCSDHGYDPEAIMHERRITDTQIAEWKAIAERATAGEWFVSGVRFRMNGCDWHSINRYDESLKRDENIACVGYDPRTGDGRSDAALIAISRTAIPALIEEVEMLREVAKHIVWAEKHADKVCGLVDNPHVKALRAAANNARTALGSAPP